jgi:hypothetical protein
MRRRPGGVVLVVALSALSAIALVQPAGAAPGPSVTLSASENLVDLDTITVQATGFHPGDSVTAIGGGNVVLTFTSSVDTDRPDVVVAKAVVAPPTP